VNTVWNKKEGIIPMDSGVMLFVGIVMLVIIVAVVISAVTSVISGVAGSEPDEED
jgi:hypothetical protein